MPQIACRMIQLSLEHGLCQDSAMAFCMHAAIVCQQCKETSVMREAYRIGKIAIQLLKRYPSPELVPMVYSCYYGLVANHFEKFQVCADRLKKGFEGMYDYKYYPAL